MIGKKNPQFQGVSVFDADDEYITGAMAERKGMDLIVYAHVPADPDFGSSGNVFDSFYDARSCPASDF